MTKRRAQGDGTVFKRARDGKWVAQLDLGYEAGKRKRVTFTAATEKEARTRLDTARQAHAAGRFRPDTRVTVEVFLNDWLTNVIDPSDHAYKTKSFYRFNVTKHISPRLGKVKLSKLKRSDVQALVRMLRESGAGDRTIQAAHATLRVALNEAVACDLITTNPATGVKVPRPRRNPETVHPIERQVVVDLLAAAEAERLGAMFLLLTMLAIRKGEVLGVRWSRIDLDKCLLNVDTAVERQKGVGMVFKGTKNYRSVPHSLPLVCVDALRRHRARQAEERLRAGPLWTDLDLVFCTDTGRILDEAVPNKLMNRILKSLGYPHERVHNLRHTAATTAVEVSHGDVHAVKSFLNHQSIAVTEGYLHMSADTKRWLAQAICDYYDGTKPDHAADA